MATPSKQLPFVLDNAPDAISVLHCIADWAAHAKTLDIATGHLQIGGLLAVTGAAKGRPLRILMGDEVSLHLLRYCQKRQLPPLTSICVSERTGQPSHGYTNRVSGTPEELHRDREEVYGHEWYRDRPVTAEELKALAAGS